MRAFFGHICSFVGFFGYVFGFIIFLSEVSYFFRQVLLLLAPLSALYLSFCFRLARFRLLGWTPTTLTDDVITTPKMA